MNYFRKGFSHKNDLDIEKLGVTLEELKKMRALSKNPHSMLKNISEHIISHSKAKKFL